MGWSKNPGHSFNMLEELHRNFSWISPLPPAVSAKNLPGEWTQLWTVCPMKRINRHPVESDEDSAPESIADTEDWGNRDADLDNTNDTNDDCSADIESGIEKVNAIEVPGCPEHCDGSAAHNVPGLIRHTWKLNRPAEMVLLTGNSIETRRTRRLMIK